MNKPKLKCIIRILTQFDNLIESEFRVFSISIVILQEYIAIMKRLNISSEEAYKLVYVIYLYI